MVKYPTSHGGTLKISATPVSDNMFKTRDNTIVIKGKQANIYHNYVAKALFATKKSRPDIHTAVSF